MPLDARVLDDRQYDEIVAEAKTRISRYAPEWTDHNDSDPGIALIQLFAWMTDILLYRLNRVPERNYVAFLKLLGIEQAPAQPASVDLTFTLARKDVADVLVPKGTLVAVAGGGATPIVFETDEALYALGADLVKVQTWDGSAYTRCDNQKTDRQGFYPFGPSPKEGNALLLGFDSPAEFTRERVNLCVYVNSDGLKPEGYHCDIDLTTLPAPATLRWEFMDSGKEWQPLQLGQDETRALTRSGHIFFQGPGAQIAKNTLGSITAPLYWIRCRLEINTYEVAPRLDLILTNTTSGTNAQTQRDEVVGGSNGNPNQVLRLAHAPVVARTKEEQVQGADGGPVTLKSLRLEVDEGAGFAAWQEVEDFYSSGKDSPHYILNRTTGELRFGDGQKGRIPVANPAHPADNIIARAYRYGGGRAGNVGAETVKELQTSVEGVKSVSNWRPATGGADEEALEHAKLRAPEALKSKDRAVTADDFEYLAKGTPGARVARAKALPLVHPRFPGEQMPGVVTVIVVPDTDAQLPVPNQATLRAVCAHLNKHRLLTTEVYVVPPTYHRVRVEADLFVQPSADLGEAKRAVEHALKQYFDPLCGGDTGQGWEFGGTIYYSQVYRCVLQPGIARIRSGHLTISVDDQQGAFCQDVHIEDGSLVYSKDHDIRVAYS